MEQETKKCPYCGEEILAVATKCKHCGEWLNQDQEVTASKKDRKENRTIFYNDSKSIESQNYDVQETMDKASYPVSDIDIPKWANILFWISVIGSFACMWHDLGFSGHHIAAKGIGVLISIASWVPYWLSSILQCIGEAGLFYLLIKLTKRLGKPIGIVGFIMILYLLVLAFFKISDVSLIGFSILVLGLVSYFVIGFMLLFKYNNSLKGLGIIFVVYIFISFINIVLENLTEYSALIIFVTDLIYLYAFKECLTIVDNDPDGSSSTYPLLIMGGGVVGLAILYGLLGSCDSKSDISVDKNVTTEQIVDDTSDVDIDVVLEDGVVDEMEGNIEGYEEIVSSRSIAVINDPDGYTNVRSQPSLSSDIVTQMLEGEEFSYESFNDKWVKVYDDDGDFIGYMAANRVRPLR